MRTSTVKIMSMKKSDVAPIQITELLGDGIGPELAESIHAVAESLPVDFNFHQVDWSLVNREARGDSVIDEANDVDIAMFDPAGGTAPDIAGKNLANPAAVLLAFGMLLDHINRYDLGHALRLSLLGCIENGHSTRDLGGKLNTDEFTKIVIDNIPAPLPG